MPKASTCRPVRTAQPAVYVVSRLLRQLRVLSGRPGERLLVAVHADPTNPSRIYRLIVTHEQNVVYFRFALPCRPDCLASCETCPHADIEPPPMWSYRTRMSRDLLICTINDWDSSPVVSWENVPPNPGETMRAYVDRLGRWLFARLLH